MTIALPITTALLVLAEGAAAQDRPWSFGELLRNVHVAAYASPGICPASDAMALYAFNATGRHPSQPGVTVSELTYSVVGFGEDGRVLSLPEDQNKVLPGDLPAGGESISCVTSAARAHGATHFAVRINSVRVHR